jgi:prepilin-type N-terminal cleavage/methylation domain-containing protein
MRFSPRGFTLIELMITLSIFFILSLSTYISYSHFQKKTLLNQGVKEITKSIYDARNLAINGIDSGSGNLSIGLYFDSTSEETQKKLQYFSYPYTFSGSQIVPEAL